jgi:hypothetical protein
LNKPGNAVFMDEVQIVLHAYAVIFSISIVHTIDLFAWIPVTLETEGGLASGFMINSRAFFEQVGTPLVSRSTANAPASLQIIYESKITAAKGAIHSAGGNKPLCFFNCHVY